MKIIYFPSVTKEVSVKVPQLDDNDTFYVNVITEPNEQTINLSDSIVEELSNDICDGCSKYNYRVAKDLVDSKLEEKLTNDPKFFEKVKKKLVVGAFRENTFDESTHEERIYLLRRWSDNTKYLKEYYSKNTNKCPGHKQLEYLCAEEKENFEEYGICRNPNKPFKDIDKAVVQVPELIWIADMSLFEKETYSVYIVRNKNKLGNKVRIITAPYTLGNVYDSGSICWGAAKSPNDFRAAYSTFFSSTFNRDLVPHCFNSDYDPESNDDDEDEDEDSYNEYNYPYHEDDRYDITKHYHNFTGDEKFLNHLERGVTFWEDKSYWFKDDKAIGLLSYNSINGDGKPVPVINGVKLLTDERYTKLLGTYRVTVKQECSTVLAWIYKVNHQKGMALVKPFLGYPDDKLKVIDLNKLEKDSFVLTRTDLTKLFKGIDDTEYSEFVKNLEFDHYTQKNQLEGALIYLDAIHKQYRISKDDIVVEIALRTEEDKQEYKEYTQREIEDLLTNLKNNDTINN